MNILIQTQLSSYTPDGTWTLECDSGWNMMMGRVAVMLKTDPTIHVDIMCPEFKHVITSPMKLNKDLFDAHGDRLRLIQHKIIPNALATRYDFDFQSIGKKLLEYADRRYDIVYVNDPMLLRNFQALFFITMKYRPKFVTHSHFIDNPSCPKFPTEASLWQGQVEAARKSDLNFWQCESAMNVFFLEMSCEYKDHIVTEVRAKSKPWDDGYSSSEINSLINVNNIRFDRKRFIELSQQKTILFVPNRIGDGKRSSDYTNCGKFMFEVLPALRLTRDDFVVVCGNPNQKISNDELEQTCGQHGYLNLVPDSLTRDEYKWIASRSHIVVSLYDQDSYGGTSNRECIDLGCAPLMLNNYEYASIAKAIGFERWLVKPDFSDIVSKAGELIDVCGACATSQTAGYLEFLNTMTRMRQFVQERCSYEKTTVDALNAMKSLLT